MTTQETGGERYQRLRKAAVALGHKTRGLKMADLERLTGEAPRVAAAKSPKATAPKIDPDAAKAAKAKATRASKAKAAKEATKADAKSKKRRRSNGARMLRALFPDSLPGRGR